MGLFAKGPKGEKCSVCKGIMEPGEERLYAIPSVMVGHYTRREHGKWYRDNLVPIDAKSQIPTGMYGARVRFFKCPGCGKERAVITPFLPVRDAEKTELPVALEYLELDAFLGR